ncbi:hypothetical protein [Streptomyces sp. NPDC055681]
MPTISLLGRLLSMINLSANGCTDVPQGPTRRDWPAMGSHGAFLVALFTEMYGIPPRSI